MMSLVASLLLSGSSPICVSDQLDTVRPAPPGAKTPGLELKGTSRPRSHPEGSGWASGLSHELDQAIDRCVCEERQRLIMSACDGPQCPPEDAGGALLRRAVFVYSCCSLNVSLILELFFKEITLMARREIL